jgi:hypothetical protein
MKLISAINNQDKKNAILSIPMNILLLLPDNYFNDFPSAILSRIKTEKLQNKEIAIVFSVRRKISDYKVWLAAASVAVLLLARLHYS